MKLEHVLLMPRILMWLQDFWKICTSIVEYIILTTLFWIIFGTRIFSMYDLNSYASLMSKKIINPFFSEIIN